MDHNPGRACYETYFSAQQYQTQANPWISSPYGDEGWPSSAQPSARQGKGEVDALVSGGGAGGVATPTGFSRSRRLTQTAEYSRVFARSRRSSDGLFTVLARDNDGLGPRLGLAISKRAAKKAVQRNRLKRVAREVFRQRTDLPSLDFVVLARVDAKTASAAELRASLAQHFERLAGRS